MWDELPSSASTRLERHHRALECALIGLRADPHGVQAAVPEQRRYRRQIHRLDQAAGRIVAETMWMDMGHICAPDEYGQ
jgi:hypothetical protein